MTMQESSVIPRRRYVTQGFRFNLSMLPVIRKAVNQRVSDSDIAKMLGCRRETVQRIRKSKGISPLPNLQSIRIKITHHALNRLETEAFNRGLTVEQLAARLIERVVEGNLFNALLED